MLVNCEQTSHYVTFLIYTKVTFFISIEKSLKFTISEQGLVVKFGEVSRKHTRAICFVYLAFLPKQFLFAGVLIIENSFLKKDMFSHFTQ